MLEQRADFVRGNRGILALLEYCLEQKRHSDKFLLCEATVLLQVRQRAEFMLEPKQEAGVAEPTADLFRTKGTLAANGQSERQTYLGANGRLIA